MSAIELALAEDRGDTPCEPAISHSCDRCGEWLHGHAIPLNDAAMCELLAHTDDVRRSVCGYCLAAEAEGEALIASICALDAEGWYP